jgi:hypothetical protein
MAGKRGTGKKSGRGGKRAGAGRPKGSRNRKSLFADALAEQMLGRFAQASGVDSNDDLKPVLRETIEKLVNLAFQSASEPTRIMAIREVLHTTIGKPRMAEPPPKTRANNKVIHRWAKNESEAMYDPARERIKKMILGESYRDENKADGPEGGSK